MPDSLSPRKDSTLYAYMLRSHEQVRDQILCLLAAMQANAAVSLGDRWADDRLSSSLVEAVKARVAA